MKPFWIEINLWSPYYWKTTAEESWYGWQAYGSHTPGRFRAWIDLKLVYLAIHWGIED